MIDPVLGPSRLCMGCHDGAVAIDAYYGSTGTTSLVEGDGWGEIGVGLNGNLTNDHPIGFDFDYVAGLDEEIVDATATFKSNTDVAIADVLYTDSFSGARVMTCSTCHDVHNTANVENWFLYAPQQNSDFCTSCHIK